MKALDLFCGMGGASLGLKWAGVDVVGVEFDETAARLHEHVCGEGTTVVGDIAALDPADFGPVDVLWASPPCQPFSHAGLKLGMDDPRAHLIFEVPRWVEVLRPRVVVCEQVKAVLPWWEAFAETLGGFGYQTWTGKLRSEQFGVPQTRERAFLLARLGSVPVVPPAPTHRKYHSRAPHLRPADEHLPCWVSMGEALDVTGRIGFPRRDDLGGDGYRERHMRPADEPALTMTSKGRSWVVDTRCDSRPGVGAVQVRSSEHPSTSFTTKSGMQWVTSRPDRKITVRDGLVIQSFPPDVLDGVTTTKTAAFKAIGNAVPPLWAHKIIEHMMGMEQHAHQPDGQRVLDLGAAGDADPGERARIVISDPPGCPGDADAVA
jgi:DNA (cytosine-5)-methyltransferase 1